MYRSSLFVSAAFLLVFGGVPVISAAEDEDKGASLGIVFSESQINRRAFDAWMANAAWNGTEDLYALNRSVPIQDFVYAPFNDPGNKRSMDVPEAKVAKSPTEFQQFLTAITVDRRGDKQFFSGLLNALNLVRPRNGPTPTSRAGGTRNGTQAEQQATLANANFKAIAERRISRSLIAVFLTAPGKPTDKHLLPQVLKLIEQKQVVVLFVQLLYTVDNTDDESYSEIASTSSGQALRQDNIAPDKVIPYLNDLLQPNKVNIVVADKKGGSKDEYSVVVDKTIDQMTVAIAGLASVTITIKNPEGKILTDRKYIRLLDRAATDGEDGKKVEFLMNSWPIKVVRINKPEPGIWNITGQSTSDHTFRVTGISKVDFLLGFSAHRAVLLNNTFLLPLKGVENRITVTSIDVNVVRKIVKLEIIALNGTAMFNINATMIDSQGGVFRSEPFTPPDVSFFITITAEANDGEILQRTSKTSMTPVPPLPEMLLIKDEN